jgi:hypothetical protein
MDTELLQQIVRVREEAKAALGNPRPYGFLPELIEYFDLMEAIVCQGASHPRYSRVERRKLLGGFGKIALDDYSFSESKLGSEMLAVMNRFAEGA